MSLADKTLTCRDCAAEFTFTVGEQEFYQSRGLENEPSRCAECRTAKRRSRFSGSGSGSGYQRGPRETHQATCAACGVECEVPFQPRNDRPVYCNECFVKMRGQR